MFAKLLKHEWKSTAGILGIFSIAALGVGILGAVILRILVTFGESIVATESPLVLVLFALGMMLFFLFLALVVYGAGTQFFLLYRFYKNKFTDQGYLTFTLPVNSHQIFLSSLLNIVIWTTISTLVILTAVAIALVFGTASEGLVNPDALSFVLELIFGLTVLYGSLFDGATVIITLIQAVISLFSGILLMMTCITIGAVIAKKHKILTAFGIYYGISTVVGVLSSVGMILFMLVEFSELAGGGDLSLVLIFLFETVLQLAMAIGGYFLSTWLMQNRLNLP